MATYFLDPESGSDAADGTTFANRWKTFGSGATAARIAPGDTVRIIASADPVSPASATWTDNSGTVTWAAAKNKVIDDCETNWTAAANITCALNSGRKQGGNAQGITPSAGFTTGKMCYRTLPGTLDLSAFEQVSFWFRYGTLVSAGQVELKLCSDTTGDTPVDTLALPAGLASNWRCVVINKGSALGSAIASIALYATADPATTAMRIDNIVACKAVGSSDCVTLEHVIGKHSVGEPEWYSILSIGDDTVVLGGANNTEVAGANSAPRPYRGTTESVATYVLRGLMANWTTAERAIQDSGTEGSPITFSGGWDRTAMTTQSGVSCLQGSHFLTTAISATSRAFIKLSKVSALNFTDALFGDGTNTNVELDVEQTVGCANGVLSGSASASKSYQISFGYIQGATTALNFISANTDTNPRTVRGTRIHGSAISTVLGALALIPGCRFVIGKIDNSGGFGVSDGNLADNTSGDLYGCTLQNNAGVDVKMGAGRQTIRLWDCVYTDAAGISSTAGALARLLSTRDQGSATSHKVIARYFTAASATDERHTASGVSWKVNPLSTTECTSKTPATFSLAKVAVTASALVTLKVWVRRTNTGLSLGFRIRANELPGVGASDLQTLMSAAANTWEEITLTFTPTVAGVVEVEAVAYGGTTYSGWFDDFSASQA